MTDGILSSNLIVQSNGVLQGGPKSPKDFILTTWDMQHNTLKRTTDVLMLQFADDVVLASPDLSQLQHAFNNLISWSSDNKLQINVQKTKAMKFRRGGRLRASDSITCNGTALEFVNSFKYLGFLFQPSGKTFTKHVAERCRLGQLAMLSISKLPLLSLTTALKLFDIKISPIVTYGIQVIWPYLSVSDLRQLEKIKTMYLKRVLCVSKFTKSRLVYKLTQCDFFVKQIQTQFNLSQSVAFDTFIAERQCKSLDIDFEFYYTPAMQSKFWQALNFPNRHIFTRFSVHGFHHLFCTKLSFHECDLNCMCKFCNSACGLYHYFRCSSSPFKSLSHLASSVSTSL